jgi:hypothetical protein
MSKHVSNLVDWRVTARMCEFRFRDSSRPMDYPGHWMCKFMTRPTRCMERLCPLEGNSKQADDA